MNSGFWYFQKHFWENIDFPNNGNIKLGQFLDNHIFVVLDGGNLQENDILPGRAEPETSL